MNSKKSQFSQIFVYVLALIIFSLILLYGYKAVSNFTSRADEISMLQIRKDLDNSVKKLASDFGTVVKKEIDIPSKFTEVCFVDLDRSNFALSTDICTEGERDYNAAACDSWKDKAQFNMFLIEESQDMEAFFIDKIQISDPYYQCLEVKNSRITLKLEGTGGKVKVEEWQ